MIWKVYSATVEEEVKSLLSLALPLASFGEFSADRLRVVTYNSAVTIATTTVVVAVLSVASRREWPRVAS